jgi:hypothetical protein
MRVMVQIHAIMLSVLGINQHLLQLIYLKLFPQNVVPQHKPPKLFSDMQWIILLKIPQRTKYYNHN